MATYKLQHTRPQEAATESDAEFSPWTSAAPTDSEPDVLDESDVDEAREGEAPATRWRSNTATERGHSANRRSPSRFRDAARFSTVRRSQNAPAASSSTRPFTRLDPSVYQQGSSSNNETPSLLSASLQQHPGWSGSSPSSPATDDASPVLPSAPDHDKPVMSPPGPASAGIGMARSLQLPLQSSSAPPSHHYQHQQQQAGRRKRGVRNTPPSSLVGTSGSSKQQASGFESEPDDPKAAKADDTFVELLEAAKAFMSLAPSTSKTGSSPPQIPIVRAEHVQEGGSGDEEEDDEDSRTPSIPTSFIASGGSSDVGDTIKDTDKFQRCGKGQYSGEEQPSVFRWLSQAVEVRVWQAIALCSIMFGAGFGVATFCQPLRLRLMMIR